MDSFQQGVEKGLQQRIQRSVTRTRAAYALGVLVVVYFFLTVVFGSRGGESEWFDMSDGRGTRGFGITRGGTGIDGFHKDKRVGGLPPSARRVYEDKDPLVYDDYDVDEFVLEEPHEVFNKERNKIVIVLGANIEGGVNRWKAPNEWSIERSSIVNKKKYAALHGYDLVIKDYTKSKRYSDDHREGWQKFDMIKSVMDEYANGDWFWYLDLRTFIMEPQLSVEEVVFDQLDELISRNLIYFNPSKLDLEVPFVHADEPINMILAQDCGGFNLHSFLVKKTSWTMTLFDLLFDPVVYLQQHTSWLNGEKNALEYYYNTFGWVRSRVAFVPTKLISALPKGACPDFKKDDAFFYNETTRDFVVDMVGCEFHRNCWDEMEYFKQLSTDLNKSWFKKLFRV